MEIKQISKEVECKYHGKMLGVSIRHTDPKGFGHYIETCSRCVDKAIREYQISLQGNSPKKNLSICPNCGGPADRGHDRCMPPNPYYCSKCDQNPGR